MADLFDTRGQPDRDRMEFWVDTVCREILPVQIDPRNDAQPRAAMQCTNIGPIGLRKVVGGDHVYVRGTRDVQRGDPDTVQIGMPMHGGSLLIQDDREAVLQAGDIVVYDSARPFTLVMENRFNWQVFLIPKEKLGKSDTELTTITARPLDATNGPVALVAHFLNDLASHIDTVDGTPSAAAIGETTSDLITTLINEQLGHQWQPTGADAVLREQALLHLMDRHGDPQLSPTMIAAALCVSVRRLHQVFESTEFTVMDRLRAIRLESIHRDLADPRLAAIPISRLSARHGLPNPTVFGRQFRSVYGESPRSFRARFM